MPADRPNPSTTDSPGIIGKMSRLRANSGATAGELREFVKQLRGRSPQEVIGVVAQSNLIRATAMAALGTIVLLLVFTILPAMMAKPKPIAITPPTPAAAPPAAAKTDDTKTTTPDPANAAKSKDKEVADKLGIGETKTADPKRNPLDSVGDDLFKDIK